MEKTTGGSNDRVQRRLNTVKVVIDLLNHELDAAKADRNISLERDRLDATVTTLELFVEDVEALLRGGEDRRVLETARTTSSARVP